MKTVGQIDWCEKLWRTRCVTVDISNVLCIPEKPEESILKAYTHAHAYAHTQLEKMDGFNLTWSLYVYSTCVRVSHCGW